MYMQDRVQWKIIKRVINVDQRIMFKYDLKFQKNNTFSDNIPYFKAFPEFYNSCDMYMKSPAGKHNYWVIKLGMIFFLYTIS